MQVCGQSRGYGMHGHAMKPEHTRLHEALAALAPPRRFQLLLLLLGGAERSVSQLAAAVRLSQSCTTRHLQALERAGLVKGRRDGKRVVFRPLPRDSEAASVLASLPGGVGEAIGPLAATAPARTISVGNAGPASHVPTPPGAAGAARVRAVRAPAAAASLAVPAPERVAGRPAGESGNNSVSDAPAPPPRPRPRQDLEDYLL